MTKISVNNAASATSDVSLPRQRLHLKVASPAVAYAEILEPTLLITLMSHRDTLKSFEYNFCLSDIARGPPVML